LLPQFDAVDPTIPKWNDQDLCLLDIIFTVWEKACRCASTNQPDKFKCSSLLKMVKEKWKFCGERLGHGIHVKRHPSGRFDFDGKSLLQFVAHHTSKTKDRAQLQTLLQERLDDHYNSIPAKYQPADFSTPLHVHWISAETAFRPDRVRRPPPRRKAKQPKPRPPRPPQPFGDLNDSANLDCALDFAVAAILK
jgi:hypothetical protein